MLLSKETIHATAAQREAIQMQCNASPFCKCAEYEECKTEVFSYSMFLS